MGLVSDLHTVVEMVSVKLSEAKHEEIGVGLKNIRVFLWMCRWIVFVLNSGSVGLNIYHMDPHSDGSY